MPRCALPGDAQTIRFDEFFAVDTLVDAILDAVDPSSLVVSSRLTFRASCAEPVIQARLGGALWELRVQAWARAITTLSQRSKQRYGQGPSIMPALDALLDGGMAAMRSAHSFSQPTAH